MCKIPGGGDLRSESLAYSTIKHTAYQPLFQLSSPTPGVFCTYRYPYSYNHARRLRLEKILYLELSRSRSSDGYFKVLMDPGGGFRN
jgi:hypothetical protein